MPLIEQRLRVLQICQLLDPLPSKTRRVADKSSNWLGLHSYSAVHTKILKSQLIGQENPPKEGLGVVELELAKKQQICCTRGAYFLQRAPLPLSPPGSPPRRLLELELGLIPGCSRSKTRRKHS